MKREVFLAVTVGFILGLIITFGIWTANNNLKNHSQQTTATETGNIIPSPTGIQISTNQIGSIPLSFTSPADDETLVTTPSLTLSGRTTPGAIVAVMYESGQNLLVADSQGNFSLDINLDSGYNQITATAYDKDGNTGKAQTLVTYTTNKI